MPTHQHNPFTSLCHKRRQSGACTTHAHHIKFDPAALLWFIPTSSAWQVHAACANVKHRVAGVGADKALPGQAAAAQQAAAAAAQPGFDVDAELDRLGMEEKSLRESARRKVGAAE